MAARISGAIPAALSLAKFMTSLSAGRGGSAAPRWDEQALGEKRSAAGWPPIPLVDGGDNSVDGDGAGTEQHQNHQNRHPVDMRRPPHCRRDVDLQQRRQGEQAYGSEAGGKTQEQADRQDKFGVAEEISGNPRRNRQISILRLEQLERRRLDRGREGHGEIDPAGGPRDRNARPLDLGVARLEEDPAMTRRSPSPTSA